MLERVLIAGPEPRSPVARRGSFRFSIFSYPFRPARPSAFATTARDMDIAADHADFIELIADYAVRHPSTKATTELLFLLDKLTQASFDALTTLLNTEPRRDLRWTDSF